MKTNSIRPRRGRTLHFLVGIAGRGTIPNYIATKRPEDLITGFDRQLELVMDLIQNEMVKDEIKVKK